MNTKKYRKKPIVIEAYQTDKIMYIETLEGTMKANVGDYIITGVNGEQYPCKPDIFNQTYEPIKELKGEKQMNYLVLYDDENYTFIDAENVEDCIIQFADYTGCNSELILKALQGCQLPIDYVNMYNQFGYYDIDSILVIQQILYDKEMEK